MLPSPPPTPAAARKTRCGVLVTNLGTPAAPTAGALRPYLRQFLLDPRVIEPPPARWLWRLILDGIILRVRPRRSARLYGNIWTAEGSPLLVITRRQTMALERELERRLGMPVPVRLGMRYGEPAIAEGLAELAGLGCERVLVFPLYPQYSSPTTGSTFDAVAAALTRTRRVPGLRFIDNYHADARYIDALAASVRGYWAAHGRGKQLLISFHGVPLRYITAGDPYRAQCLETARLLAQRLELKADEWQVCFQSRFGKEPWLEPYADEVFAELGRRQTPRLDILNPGFSADCLETLEELAITGREQFQEAGGGEFHYIAALNDRPEHIEALAAIAARQLAGWVEPD